MTKQPNKKVTRLSDKILGHSPPEMNKSQRDQGGFDLETHPTQYYDSRVFQDVPRGVDDTTCPNLGSRKY